MECNSYSGIDYTAYFNHPCELRRYNKSTDDYSPDGEYGEPEIIKAWVGGAVNFYREKEQQWSLADKTYRTLTPIKDRDMLDGEVVVHSFTKYGLDGNTVEFYVAYTGG